MIWKRIRDLLRFSAHAHLRERRVANMADLVALIDRFLDDNLSYELEWDDFISWTNRNPNVEAIRDRIAATEPLFFSKHPEDRKRAIDMLVEERNAAAALIGTPPRTFEFPGRP